MPEQQQIPKKITFDEYLQLVRLQAESLTTKAFDDLTSDELRATAISGPLEMKSARSRLVKEKKIRELNQAAKVLLEDTITKWKANGSSVDGIRHWDGVIGFIDEGQQL